MTENYMTKLKIDADELHRRRSYFEITDEDLARLASLQGFAAKYNDEITEEFYRFLLSHAESRAFFADPATVGHVKKLQKAYFLKLVSGVLDLDYVEDRLRVGVAHERLGMPLKLYLGAYAVYLRLVKERLLKELRDPVAASQAFKSFQKLVFFDMSFANDTYLAAFSDSIVRHQAAIRELSTPVIRVFDRVLLLPLVGTIDTHRAHQIMERLLVRVADEQARVVIIDIAGVPVVDTKVAESLLSTTAAVRLLGAETVVTGISPVVAKTVVRLDIDVSTLHTRMRLADGIEFALGLLGKAITERTS